MPKLGDITALISDGLQTDPSPAFLWVSADAAKLEQQVEAAATQVVQGSAPEVLRDRRVLLVRAADLLAQLRSADLPPIDQMEVIVRTLQDDGATLVLDRPELLCGSDLGFDPSDALCDALSAGRIGCFIGLTNSAGVARLQLAQPRLVMMLRGVFDLDSDSDTSYHSLVLDRSDPEELGWLAVVRCKLLAPVEALDEYASGESNIRAHSTADLDELGINRSWIVAVDEGVEGIVISVRDEVANLDAESKAESIALIGARRLIGRRINEGENLEVTRMIYFAQ